MEELPIQTIRETSRNFLVLNRRKIRDEEADMRRSVNEFQIQPDTVFTIANKLKTKSSVSVSELQMLKNALIDDVVNIDVVLSVHGALRGLVRELTGHEVNKQVAAAGCCCNLGLGDSRAGVAVAKAAGPYLISALDNLTTELAITSAWTLGNLAGSGSRASEMLSAQGAVAKLIELLASSNEEISDAALYAVVRFAYQLKDDLKTEHLRKIFEILPNLQVNKITQLLFILSCHKEFPSDLISEDFLEKLLRYLAVSINENNEESITYLFRFLANCNNCGEVIVEAVSFITDNDLMGAVEYLSRTNQSVSWFLGNVCRIMIEILIKEANETPLSDFSRTVLSVFGTS